jgi:hypothetical protein
LSAGIRAGSNNSVNLFKDTVVSGVKYNSKFSLKDSSVILAAAKNGNTINLPRMVAGPPYKLSEFYGANVVYYKQEITWQVAVDGSDYYSWSAGTPLATSLPELKRHVHNRFEQISGTVTNIASYFNGIIPKRIYVNVYGSQTIVTVNGVNVLSTGNNSSGSSNVYIDVNSAYNGSFSYIGGDRGNWGGGIVVFTLLQTPTSLQNGSLNVTHRNWQYPSNSTITYKTYKGDVLINSGSLTGTNRGGTSLPFEILRTSDVKLTYSGRADVSITELPSLQNNYTTTVLINDDPPSSNAWYTCTLTYILKP